jgi:hypothetical protein
VRSSFVRWAFARGLLARGWLLSTGVYLVVVAELSPWQLILIGVFQSTTVLAVEIPAGVLADAISRRLALVAGHVVMGTGMALAGLVTSFPLLIVANCLWGLGWALNSGADVAWITDELDRPDLIDSVLARQARYEVLGNAAGVVLFGALAWATSLAVAIGTAGVAMTLLGLIITRWPESRFAPAEPGRMWQEGSSILRSGLGQVRRDRVILLVMIATMLLNGGDQALGRLYERQLVSLGLPSQPDLVVWFAAIAVVHLALSAAMLIVVEARIAGVDVARRIYVWGCAVGAVGLLLFAHAPNTSAALAGSLLARGVSSPATRVASTVWVNKRTPNQYRATMHSLLSQAENAGEIILGVACAVIAATASSTTALTAGAVFIAAAGALAGGCRVVR